MSERKPEEPPIPISWISKEDLAHCRPDFADAIAQLGEEDLAAIGSKIGDALQETYQLAMGIALDDYFKVSQPEAEEKAPPTDRPNQELQSPTTSYEANSRIFYRLTRVVNEAMVVGGFEILLREKDIAWFLELYGVLPTLYNPIPCDAQVQNEDDYEQWLEDHPKEAKKFYASIEVREQALRLLFAGVLLGRAFPDLLSSR